MSVFKPPLPPPELLFLTTGNESEDRFIKSGRSSVVDIEKILNLYGKKISDFEKILDFGVGVGRIARHLRKVDHLVGVDTLPENIKWLQKNMKFGTYILNFEYPPMLIQDNFFDLIISHSVFTHLNIIHQDAWLAELRRVLKPNGLALLSFNGDLPFDGYLQSLRDNGAPERALLHEGLYLKNGFLWVSDDSWSETIFPDWYHSMFHSPQYVLNHWSRWFEVLNWNKSGNLGFQDNVLLRKVP
jgi:SAM-dependent methyltransferase